MARRPVRVAYAGELKDAIVKLAQSARLSETVPVHGNARWTPEKLLAGCLLMSWHEAQTLTSRFEHVRELLGAIFHGWRAPASYTGYATALAGKVGLLVSRMRPALQARVRRLAGHRWQIANWIVFAADGSRFESPRTKANEEGLGCAGKDRTAPQIFHTTLLHLGTNAIWDFRCGPGTDSERRHLEDMAAGLPPGSLVTADGGFIGYELCRKLTAQGVCFLLRVGGNITLLAEQTQSHIQQDGERIWLWPKSQSTAPPCVLRLLRLKRNSQEIYLVTNVDNASRLTHAQAAEIYRRRWGIEVTYRSVKQTLNRSTWLSRTPSTVLAEHQGTLLGIWILQVISLEELSRKRIDPRQWSPAQARDACRRVLRHVFRSRAARSLTWREQLGRSAQDGYRRSRPKRARDWPHKKHDPPIQPPRIIKLTPSQRKHGQRLLKAA
jgi:Transposase DDE domain